MPRSFNSCGVINKVPGKGCVQLPRFPFQNVKNKVPPRQRYPCASRYLPLMLCLGWGRGRGGSGNPQHSPGDTAGGRVRWEEGEVSWGAVGCAGAAAGRQGP